ncbi:uncharacterized protein SAZU_4631 [Streptomyces azureus]|uniref:Uncharacterized protein n=1 Tax=Streptomyces azureus TaxID=146537 RepID=A0A0K8PQQ7_STRAJ|nr:uncharacterized protein SAZU_4631 [Streptomyces azureus]
MLRASARHNYSPEPPGDAAMPAEPLVHGLLLAETQPLRTPQAALPQPISRGIAHPEAGSGGFAIPWGQLADLSPYPPDG